ncbi:MFS transporter [Caldisphaera sp.]|uniref:MFS transporter n=1 Tax=Caldisphaera sp. TaxID=2060322 RepID=UPI003D0CC80A
MTLFAVSIPLIILSSNVLELGLGIGLAEFSLGGDENTILSYLSEMTPKNLRGKVLVGVTNVANFGAVVAAILSILTGFSLFIQKLSFATLMSITIFIIVITRFSIPESFRWKYYKNLHEKIYISKKDYFVRFYFLIAMAITIVLTYALMDLVIGPYLFPKLTSWIILAANIGETVAGFSILLFIDSFNRKLFSFIAYLGGAITMFFFIPQYIYIPKAFNIFLVLLILNGIFGEFGWASRVVYEPELFPTNSRGMNIGIVRGIAYSLYVASIFFTSSFNEFSYLIYNLGMWIIGFSGALVWLLYGIDTKKKPWKKYLI